MEQQIESAIQDSLAVDGPPGSPPTPGSEPLADAGPDGKPFAIEEPPPDDGDDDPAVLIIFSDAGSIHNIMTATGAGPAPFSGLPALPAAGATAQASYANFTAFLDALGLACGMTPDSLTQDRFRNRQHGVFHELKGHVADLFQQNLDVYQWNFGGPPQNTAGKYYRITPSGRGSTTCTNFAVGPFE